MAEICDIYTKGVYKALKYFAAWLPSTTFQLGQYGVLDGYCFQYAGTLGGLKIRFKTKKDRKPSRLKLISGSDVSITYKLAGELNPACPNIPKAKAGIKLDFSAKGAFIIEAPKTYEHAIQQPELLLKKIVSAYKAGRWDKDWVVIVRVMTAPSAFVRISKTGKSGIELSAKTKASVSTVDLGSASSVFQTRHEYGSSLETGPGVNATPIFQVWKLKRRRSSRPRLDAPSIPGRIAEWVGMTPSIARESSEECESLYFDVVEEGDLNESITMLGEGE